MKRDHKTKEILSWRTLASCKQIPIERISTMKSKCTLVFEGAAVLELLAQRRGHLVTFHPMVLVPIPALALYWSKTMASTLCQMGNPAYPKLTQQIKSSMHGVMRHFQQPQRLRKEWRGMTRSGRLLEAMISRNFCPPEASPRLCSPQIICPSPS